MGHTILCAQENATEIFDQRDGFVFNGILDMDQDRYDRMVLCTGSGPVLFDGQTFSPLFKEPSMIAMEAHICEEGDVLLSMADGTTQRWDGKKTSLLDVPLGLKCVITGEEEVAQMVTDRYVIRKNKSHLDTIYAVANGRLIEQAIGVRDDLILLENDGVSQLKADGSVLSHEYPKSGLSVIKAYKRGKIILLVSDRHGVYGFDPLITQTPFFRFDHEEEVSGVVQASDMDSNGDLVLLMADGRLLTLDYDTRRLTELASDPAVAQMDKSRILVDRFQNIWTATRSHGLLLQRQAAITQLTDNLPAGERSVDMTVSEDILAQVTDGGIRFYRKSPNGDDWLAERQLPMQGVLCVAAYGQKFYVGLSNHAGVQIVDVDGAISPLKGLDHGVTVQSIVADDGRLHIGTVANGLIVYSIEEERIVQKFDTSSGLASNGVEKVSIDSEGTVWVLTNPLGVQYISGDDVGGVKLSSQLVPEKVTNVVEDNYGNIYLSIYGKGLFQIEDDELLHIDLGTPLSTNIAHLSTDWDGNLWMACGDAFLRLGLPSLTVDSFPTSRTGLNGVLSGVGMKQASDNELYFMTDRGVCRLDRRFESLGESQAELRFDMVRLNGKATDLAELSSLANGDYSLELFFSTCCLHAPKRVRYEYRVDGATEGIPIQTDKGRAYVNHLGAGDHLVQIRATDCDGNWNEQWLPLRISISKPFYFQAGFILAMIALIALIVQLGFRLRTRSIRMQNERLLRKVNWRTRELTERTAELRHMNEEMNSSIDYAINIQRAMLPSERIMKQDLEDLHLYYSPKEQLSGDFYWASSVGNHSVIVCGDCTGHGVPGALVSMLCMSELDKAVNGEGLIDPAQILHRVDAKIVEMLHSNDKFHSHDGMAISLCVIDKAARRLHFSGAGQPMYFQTSEGLQIAKGCRDHIGGAIGGNKVFETSSFDLDEVKRVFLFTDGLSDQFGGKRFKKFMKRRIREHLSSQMEEEMSAQCRSLTEAFESWKEEQEQTDDVLFIAFEA